jgi:hypothetical protein
MLITTENAREFQRRGVAKRLENAAKAKQVQPSAEPSTEPSNPPDTAFVSARLARVRAQLDRLDALISEQLDAGKELDPQAIDRLAAASSKFEEQERRLSNRSLPPTKRGAETPKRNGLALEKM